MSRLDDTRKKYGAFEVAVPEEQSLHCPECHMVGMHEVKCSRSWSPTNVVVDGLNHQQSSVPYDFDPDPEAA